MRKRISSSSLGAVCLVLVASGLSRAQDSLSPEAAAAFTLTPVVSNLGAVTDMRFLPDGRLLIVEKDGSVLLGDVRLGTSSPAGAVPVDTSSEKGLLGVEVDPHFADNHFIYLYYSCRDALGTVPCDDLNRHRVSRFVLDPATGQLELNSETVLLSGLRGPANHDGGGLAIGPDGKLYVGVGDTGCNSNAPPGQNITNWFATCLSNANGKVLRINLDGTIPDDNPLVNMDAGTACGATCGVQVDPGISAAPRTEIFAWGFRNPWRLSFDRVTGNLWVGDVGEITHEELNIVRKGKHYGWPLREGAAGQDPSRCEQLTPGSGNCVDPVYFCRHGARAGGVDGQCTSINGGTFVDTCSWPAPWRGRYYFGDNANRHLFFLNVNATRDGLPTDGGVARGDLATFSGKLPISFQVGPDGDLYVGALGEQGNNGTVFRISPIARDVCPDGGVPDGGVGDGGVGDGGADGGV
ncbi:MAG: PQQ-dependent sugar dehydrogenase, partial [Myxococcaceae bacterium]|nr:PQQ-dependent sugar dehydrogenase [Myxococcaceae bacterium]